jgi:hypothetical protein
MAVQLTDPGVVLLADGRVFALGGYDKSTDAGSKQAWFFDPKSDAVTPAPQDTVERLAESLTLLPSGRVLVAGGNDDGSTRLFDPVKGTYSDAGFLLDRRYAHGAIALGANVLIAGGTVDRGGTSGDTDKSELWSDPSETTTDAGAVTSPPPATSVGGSFTRCNKDAECSTGHCVDGVCCDTACADRCHSCALPSSPGVCTLEPIGVDLRGECGAALSCTGTCGPEGKCIGSLKGSLCAKSTCTSGSTGLGPSTCEAQGGTCPTDQATAFDCAPYACEPAFGACRTSCGTSADCAGGYLCEANSHTCIAPAPSNDDGGGCAIGRGSRASLLGVLIALSAIARLRRLTS